MDQFLEQAHQILEHGSVFNTMDFFWKICIHFWKNGLDFGKTDLFLEDFGSDFGRIGQNLDEWIRFWVN